jgi:hypothetical protein
MLDRIPLLAAFLDPLSEECAPDAMRWPHCRSSDKQNRNKLELVKMAHSTTPSSNSIVY